MRIAQESYEQILEATSHKTAAAQHPNSHLQNGCNLTKGYWMNNKQNGGWFGLLGFMVYQPL